MLDSIERRSRDNVGRRQTARVYIDPYIMRRFMNQSEIEAEEARTFSSRFKRADDVLSETGHDFRDGIDSCDCDCAASGKICIRCCTSRDLIGVPPNLSEHIEVTNRRPKAVGGRILDQVFDLLMPYEVACLLGFALAEE
ncbi:MAG TPA: hypothetical protein VHD69_02510 [Candidatus Paceibacterota bacterium]|nr:hypothetical protein [Candidatus Paceibacterota bacterium]